MELKDVEKYINDGIKARSGIDPKQVLDVGKEIGRRMLEGKKLILCGNGGSAADAQHIAAEFVCKFKKERKALPAFALHTNTSTITAIGNDYSYDNIYERQIEAFASAGDIVIGISTSGNSINVIKAIEKANKLGCLTIAFTSKSGGKLKEKASIVFSIDSNDTPIVQESYLAVGHMLSQIVEDMV
jgi:D-sedoheptulose 7-phosphate isomerase